MWGSKEDRFIDWLTGGKSSFPYLQGDPPYIPPIKGQTPLKGAYTKPQDGFCVICGSHGLYKDVDKNWYCEEHYGKLYSG